MRAKNRTRRHSGKHHAEASEKQTRSKREANKKQARSKQEASEKQDGVQLQQAGSKAHVLYDDGDEETLDLSEENFKIICSSGMSELMDATADVNGENIDCGGDFKENKRG
eukprot:gene3138-biopygen3081